MSNAETRFVVEWTPWADVKAAAEAKGWTDKDSAADFVEISDFERGRTFPSFAPAVAFARSVAEADTWRCPRIRREVLTKHDTDDLGRKVDASETWDTDATWEVFSDEADPTEDAPAWRDAA